MMAKSTSPSRTGAPTAPAPRASLSPACTLFDEMDAEARRDGFAVDEEAYRRAGRDPMVAIACAGDLAARVCFLGRDLGRDEVRHAQPLVGASGRRVRLGVLKASGISPSPDDPRLEAALGHAFFANVVPYKPAGNRPFAPDVVARFRPLVERLLAGHWQGEAIIALGEEAYRWLANHEDAMPAAVPGGEPGPAPSWSDLCHAGTPVRRRLAAVCHGVRHERTVTVYPMPHPSPVNARFARLFPDLLARCLGSLNRG